MLASPAIAAARLADFGNDNMTQIKVSQ